VQHRTSIQLEASDLLNICFTSPGTRTGLYFSSRNTTVAVAWHDTCGTTQKQQQVQGSPTYTQHPHWPVLLIQNTTVAVAWHATCNTTRKNHPNVHFECSGRVHRAFRRACAETNIDLKHWRQVHRHAKQCCSCWMQSGMRGTKVLLCCFCCVHTAVQRVRQNSKLPLLWLLLVPPLQPKAAVTLKG
jgi:hypothetical protein